MSVSPTASSRLHVSTVGLSTGRLISQAHTISGIPCCTTAVSSGTLTSPSMDRDRLFNDVGLRGSYIRESGHPTEEIQLIVLAGPHD